MRFPPAQAEIYGGPRSQWLADILRRLPYLQSLVVAHIPFFDYAALSSLVKLSQPDPVRGTQLATYQLRLLDASNCYNLTPQSLANALKLFPGLVYLDLSSTTSARYYEVLSSFSSLQALQILKLQRLWMSDDDLAHLLRVVGRRLCNLDVRHNRITDRGAANLIQDAMRAPAHMSNGRRTPPRLSSKTERILASEKQADHIRERLTSGFVSDLGIEAESGQGITHLYISDNQITAAGASGLLRCKQLRVLDIGSIVVERLQAHHPKYELSPEIVSLPTAECLTPIIEGNADKLTYLRISHEIVTRLSSTKEAKAFEVEDTSLLALPKHAAELEITGVPPRELHSEHLNEAEAEVSFLAELEGSPVDVRGPLIEMDTGADPRAQPLSEPEHAPQPISATSPVLDSTGGLFSPISPMSPQHAPSGVTHPSSNGHLVVPGPSSLPEVAVADGLEVHSSSDSKIHHRRHRTYSGVHDEHEARKRFRLSEDHNLLASTLKEIRTLVLTNVPFKSDTANTANNTIKFIEGCAEEERWAALKASVGYQLPPGPDRRSAEKQYAQTLFPFRKLVLEMASETAKTPSSSSHWQRGARPGSRGMLSSTLDPDCETYLNAAKDDFSFFGSEECGQPDTEISSRIPFAAFREKMTIEPDTARAGELRNGKDLAVQQPVYDVLAEVSRFRRMKKAEHDAAILAGGEQVDGYWSGIVEVIRPR